MAVELTWIHKRQEEIGRFWASQGEYLLKDPESITGIRTPAVQCSMREQNQSENIDYSNRPVQCLRTSCCEASCLRHTETETMIIVGVYFWCLTCTMNVHAIVCKGDIFPMKKYEKPRQPVPQKQSIAYRLLLQADANCIQLPQDIEVARELQKFNQVKIFRPTYSHARTPLD